LSDFQQIKRAQAGPVNNINRYHLALPPIEITLERSDVRYVLTHLILAKTNFWITCAYSVISFQTVVIKIGYVTEKLSLEHEANILKQLAGIEEVQQFVDFGRIVNSDYS